MKVIHRSTETLIVRASGLAPRLTGAAFMAASLVSWRLASAPERSAGSAVVAALFLLVGILCVALSATTVHVFDRRTRTVTVTRHGLWRTERSEYQLRDVIDAELERSTSDEGAAMYRAALVMRGWQRVPFTSYYSSGYQEKAAAVDAVRAFLAPAGAPAPPSAADIERARRAALASAARRNTSRLVAAIAVFATMFVLLGARMAWLDHRRLTTYEPTEVSVIASSVARSVHGDGAVTYRPVVLYHYTVNGARYASDHVTALGESRGGRWAHDLAARFAPRRTYVGFYDPRQPARSYLVRERSRTPYAIIAVPGLLLALLAWARRRGADAAD